MIWIKLTHLWEQVFLLTVFSPLTSDKKANSNPKVTRKVYLFSAKYYNIELHMSNFKCHLLLSYKFPRPLDRKVPTPCLMYDVMFNNRSVHMRIYCHTIFRGNGVNTQLTFANAKLVLMRQQTNKQIKVRAIWSILFLISKIKLFHWDFFNC